jgi:hypothetical protein
MRLIGNVAIVVACVAAVPVAAQHGPRPLDDHQLLDAAREAVRAPDALTLARSREASSTIAARFRVRTNVATVPQGPLGARDRVHQRLAGSMIDFYPIDGKGFRISAGSRFYDVRAASSGGATTGPDASARALLAVPRTATAPAAKAGLKGSTPALTMGYAGTLGPSTNVGLELGAMKGRAYAGTADQGAHDSDGGKVNPVVSLVVGRHF